MEKIINALADGIRGIGLEAVIVPQEAASSRTRVELSFAGIEAAGIDTQNPDAGAGGWERVTLSAVFCSEGTHIKWVTGVILAARRMAALQTSPMRLRVALPGVTAGPDMVTLEACWKRLSPGRFEYPEEDQTAMPVRYAEQWEVTVAYPARIIGYNPEE